MNPDELEASVNETMALYDREAIEAMMLEGLIENMGVDESVVSEYLADMSDEDLNTLFEESLTLQIKGQYAQSVIEQLMPIPQEQKIIALDQMLNELTSSEFSFYYDEVMEFSESTIEKNLENMGDIDLESPSTISIYASTFADKDIIEETISDYNASFEDELMKIKYVDYIGIIMSSVSTIINAITYVLLAFVAISLIVSSIMIGVITLISVQERTKEIGVLRAIGASKGDVSRLFNAETIIIGFLSGLLGIVVTILLTIPINNILRSVTGIPNLNARLPLDAALILFLISILLSVIAGLIPSRSAAKKDPVVALRTE